MEWLEEQAQAWANASASTTSDSTHKTEESVIEVKPIMRNMQSVFRGETKTFDVFRFLALPLELRAKVYRPFWARNGWELGRAPLGQTQLNTGAEMIASPPVVTQALAGLDPDTLAGTIALSNSRCALVFDNSILFTDDKIIHDFYDYLLTQLLPFEIAIEDRVIAIVNKDSGETEVQQVVRMQNHSMFNNPSCRDAMKRVTRINIGVSISRPWTTEGLGYSMCHPIFEELPFIDEIDKLLEHAPLLTQVSLDIDSEMRMMDGNRLGVNWDWLLSLLNPLTLKHPAIKVIYVADKYNVNDKSALWWTYKDAETGLWSKLKNLGDYNFDLTELQHDLSRAQVDPR